jgi:hypothetical protein
MTATMPAAMAARQCSGEMAATNDALSGDEGTTIVLATSLHIDLGYRLSWIKWRSR